MSIACKTTHMLLICGLFVACTAALTAQRTYIDDITKRKEEQRLATATSTLTLSTVFPHDFRLWAAMPQLVDLKVFNPRETAGEAEVRIRIAASDGKSEARSREFALPVVVVGSGWNTYTAADLFRDVDLEWFDGDRRTMDFSDTLREGRYILHIDLKPRTQLDSISPAGAGSAFTVVDLTRPVPEQALYIWDADSTLPESLSLAWQYPVEVRLPGFQWLVRIAEAPAEESTPADMERLPIVLERLAGDSTRLLLFSPASYFQPGRRYVWSVQPYYGTTASAVWPKPVVFMLPPL